MTGQNVQVSETDIAVVGMAGRFPGARSVAELWAIVRDGIEALTVLSDEELAAAGVDRARLRDPSYVKSAFLLPDMDMFDASFFGLSPRDAAIMDPQHRHFLECAWAALEDAGHAPGTFDGSVGVFAGCGASTYLINNLLTNPDLLRNVGFFLLRHTGNDKDFLATRVSYALDLRGPSLSVQTACSTSLSAIHLACQSLLNAECDLALAGGVTIRQPHKAGYQYVEGEIMSPDGHCRAFDEKAEGTVFGSGVGVVVLRRLADAIADGDTIYAVVKGSAINNDGAMKVGYLAPSVDGQGQAIAEALAISGVDPASIGYIETHGTGTPVGDPIEIAALVQAFGGHELSAGSIAIGSLKPNIGHLDTASGVASFIKVVQALRHRQLPPSLHFTAPNPALGIEDSPFYVNAGLREWPKGAEPRRAGVSSLGAGGTNAHVIVEEAPALDPSGPSREWQLLTLSARTPDALDRASADLAAHLRANPGQSLADIAYTQHVGRRAFAHRRTVVARDAEDAATQLDALDPKRTPVAIAPDDVQSAAFMFAGGGAQYAGMGAGLYRQEPVFREAIDRCLTIVQPSLDTDLRSLLLAPPEDRERATALLERPSLALPALFAVQYAQAKLWMSWGVAPSAMIGHSMGEYTAAHLAGVFSLEHALELVALRGRLFERVPPGGMLSVSLPADELAPLLPASLSIAAVNAPELCVASGPIDAIEALERTLTEREIDCRRVHIAIAAHSAMLEPILSEFGAFCARIPLAAPAVPMLSNVSGTWMTAEQATDPQYWVRHLRNTVRFAEGVSVLAEDPNRLLLEVGPGRTLATLAGMSPARRGGKGVFSSIRHPDDDTNDVAFMLRVLGQLWAHGAAIDWSAVHAGERRRRVPIPTYPFARVRHWIEPGSALVAAPSPEEALRKREDVAEWCYMPSWKRTITPVRADDGAVSTRALVFHDEQGIGAELASALRRRGRQVISVLPGDRFARVGDDVFVVAPGSADDHAALLGAMVADGGLPAMVVHAWNAIDVQAAGSAAHAALRDRSFYSLLHFAQAIGNEDIATPVSLTIVSTGVHHVAGEPALDPVKALLLGPCRVIGKEYSNVRARNVDLSADEAARPRARTIERIVAELDADTSDEVVALRGADRWVQTFEPASLTEGRAGWPVLAEGGVTVITGGLGGIGLEAAEQLARDGATSLVLIGRTGMPPRETWSRRRDGSDRVARQVRRIEAIESLGARVEVVAADVTDAHRLREVITDVRSRLGAIRLVVHAAGVLDDGLIGGKSVESAERVLAPKVLGALALDEAFGDESPELMVLFSSRGAVTGPAGQVDYAAANAVLDAFAHARTSLRGATTVSINWGTWQGVGMTAGGAQGPRPVNHPLLRECIEEKGGNATYLARMSPADQWVLDEHRLADGEALLPGTGYLELARAAYADRAPNGAVELSDVFFLSPFVVPEGRAGELRVALSGDGDAGAEFVIEGRIALDDDRVTAWQEHARGTIGHRAAADASATDPADIIARCTRRHQVFTGTESRLEHLALGARWSNLKRIDYGDREAIATLELPEAYRDEVGQFGLHPALLDVATACAQALIDGYEPHEDFYVPISYGSLVSYGPLPAKGYSHIRYQPAEDGGKDVAVFDVSVLDETGRVITDITGFTMMRIADHGRSIASAPQGAAEDAPAEPSAAAAGDDIEGILPGEGIEVLRRILALDVPPAQIVVSPQELGAWMAHLRVLHAAPAAAAVQASAPAATRVPEIETVLVAHEAIAECIALAREDRPGTRRIVAYLVRDPSADATVSEIRRHLRERLAEELVPQHFVELDALSLTSRGEPDIAALPDPFAAADDFVAPRTPTQRVVAEIWQELLGVARVSVHDNFLDVGGHSLLAMRALARITKKTGVRLNPSMMNLQTLEQIAAEIDRKAAPSAPAASPAAAATPDAAPAAPAPSASQAAEQSGIARRLFSAVRQSVSRV